MAGVASYFAFILILTMWGLGWSAIGAVLGTILKMPVKLSFCASLLLGPLGIIYIVFSESSTEENHQPISKTDLKASSSQHHKQTGIHSRERPIFNMVGFW